jgi:hypothetical protein
MLCLTYESLDQYDSSSLNGYEFVDHGVMHLVALRAKQEAKCTFKPNEASIEARKTTSFNSQYSNKCLRRSLQL